MLTTCLSLLLIPVCCIALTFGSLSALLTGAALSSASLFFLTLDNRRLSRKIRNLLSENSLTPGAESPSFFSSSTNSLAVEICNLLTAFKVKNQLPSQSRITLNPAISEFSLPTGPNLDSICSSAVKLAVKSAGVMGCSIILRQDDIVFWHHTPQSSEVEARLTRILNSTEKLITPGLTGIVNEKFSTRSDGFFSSYSIQFSVRIPFYLNNNSSRPNGMIFIAFDHEPNATDFKKQKALAGELSKSLNAAHKILSLTDTISSNQKLSKQKNAYISHFSHDIRSPLNNVRGILSVLELEELEESTAELVKCATKNCETLNEIVGDLIDYTRHQSGELKAEKQKINVAQTLLKSADTFFATARMKGLRLNCFHNAESFPIIAVDPRHLKRIINNILSNCIKYTAFGSISMETGSTTDKCWINIKDTGSGMSREELDRLFIPFSRFHKKEIDGIGLGMTITSILTELNGGEIDVRSAQDSGTEFTLLFPLTGTGRKPIDNSEDITDEVADNSKLSGKLLLLDDDIDCTRSLSKTLSLLGHQCLTCHSLQDARNLLNFEKPDLIISDFEIPGGGATNLLKYMRERNITTNVIISTGNPDQARQIHDPAIVAVLSKPVDLKELQLTIQNSLQQIETSSSFRQCHSA